MSLRLRAMAPEDAPAVARLATQLGYPAAPEQAAARLDAISGRPDHAAFVAFDDDGAVVGWIHLFEGRLLESDPAIEIAGLVVDETRRGEGIGRALVEEGIRWARERGAARLRVRSRVGRTEAHRFYESLGFSLVKSQAVFDRDL